MTTPSAPTVRANNALRVGAAAANRLRKNGLDLAFSAEDLNSRPTPGQLEFLKAIGTHQYRYVTSGNQGGKSAGGVRDLTWFLERKHPYFRWPKAWSPSEPLIVIVCGQDRAQLETMWKTRALPLLNSADWQDIRSGQILSQVVHRTRGDRVILLPHNYGSEHDVSHMNFYSAHYVWVDEPPKTVRVLEELQRRTDAKQSPFLFTFTLKRRNDSMQRYVEAVDPRVGKVFRLHKLDNPIYADRKEMEVAKLAGLTDAQKANILTGAYLTSETSVYEYIPEVHGGSPVKYSKSWRHVASVDPADRSNTGLTLWAECPTTGFWWCVYAEYIEALYDPVRLIEEVERRLVPFNVISGSGGRIYDAAASWFGSIAANMPEAKDWLPVLRKSGRKETMIANFQRALGTTVRLWEDACPKLIDEITDFERNENDQTKFVKSQKYHLLDTAHYFVDRKPDSLPIALTESPHERLLRLHKESLAEQAKLAVGRRANSSIFNRRWTRW